MLTTNTHGLEEVQKVVFIPRSSAKLLQSEVLLIEAVHFLTRHGEQILH